MKYFAVIGRPVAHSKSPLMFNYFFKKNKLDCCYSRIASENLKEAIDTCRLLGISGINITMPYKKELIAMADYISSEALDVEAVNTLLFEKDTLKGYNTDIYGATVPLKRCLGDLNRKKILIVGAGGAARAALYGLKKEGAECVVANRSVEKGQNVSTKFNAGFIPLDKVNTVLKNIDAVVYTVPVKIDFDLSQLKSSSVFLSAIYKQYFFKDECDEKGITYIPGEEWLIEQGRVSCSIFGFDCEGDKFGNFPEKVKKPDRISLIGFMGSGKTSVGRILAEKLNFSFVDLDKEIETGEGMYIPEIFEKHGESYFRKLEVYYLKKFKDKKGIVLSCGGGIVNTDEAADILNNLFFNVFLCGKLNILYERTENSSRPLRTNISRFEKLYRERFKNYFILSDLIVDTSHKDQDKLAGLIYYELSKVLSD